MRCIREGSKREGYLGHLVEYNGGYWGVFGSLKLAPLNPFPEEFHSFPIFQPRPPGRIQKVDPPSGSIIYTIGVLEPRIGGSTFWILPGVWEPDALPWCTSSRKVRGRGRTIPDLQRTNFFRGSKDHKHIRILHFDSQTQNTGYSRHHGL